MSRINLIILFIFGLLISCNKSTDTFVKDLHVKEIKLDNILSLHLDKLNSNKNVENLQDEFQVLVYKNDSLVFYNKNEFPVISGNEFADIKPHIRNVGNSICEIRVAKRDEYLVVGYIPLKNNFKYKNKYLNEKWLFGNQEANLNFQKLKTGNNIFDYKNNFLFNISFPKINFISVFQGELQYIIILILLSFAILPKFNKKYIVELGLLILVLFYSLLFTFGSNLFTGESIFSSSNFAFNWFIPSLVHLCILSIFLYLITSKIYLYNIKINYSKYAPLISLLIKTILFVLLFEIIKTVVLNASFPIKLYDLFNLSKEVLLLLVTLFFIATSLAYLLIKIDKAIEPVTRSFSLLMMAYFFFAIILLVCAFYITNSKIFTIILALSFLISLSKQSISAKVLIIIYYILISALVILVINKYSSVLERAKREKFAFKISQERDPYIEYLFALEADKIKKDTYILNRTNETNINDYLLERYFKKGWSNYTMFITTCKSEERLLIKPQNVEINCNQYFNSRPKSQVLVNDRDTLYMLTDKQSSSTYLGFIKFQDLSIYIEFYVKKQAIDLAYPKLLMDDSNINNNIETYSYAKYYNKKLSYSTGEYQYNDYLTYPSESKFFRENDYHHLYYIYYKDTVYIVSRPYKEITNYIAPFPILFFFLLITYYLSYLILDFRNLKFHISKISFKIRLQLYMLSLLLLSFVSIGYLSVNYYIQQNSKKAKQDLTEKLYSILFELQGKINQQPELLNQNIDGLESYLIKFSNIFFTDINVYQIDGRLMTSSRSQIFNDSLVAKLMNKQALNAFNKEHKTLHIQKEKIGNLEYWSAYIPIRSATNQIQAYINLPYFAKQKDIQEELSQYISSFLNLYLIIIALAIALLVLFSNYMIAPLKLLKDKLSTLSLTDKNEIIEWKYQDEIGALVGEYNNVVIKLKESVDRLTITERETAWREMARQIAHEIKNPLTPLKLSIQNLYRAWEDQSPDWDQRFKRFRDMALEQIDTLSIIASEFSNFAKMPEAHKQKLDLNKLVYSIVDLFKNDEQVEITLNLSTEELYIYADKEQITRAFTNIIKNACQALEGASNPCIIINLVKENDKIIVTIADNGPGIDEEAQEKIFQVNFTTKSSGMGLGLAMVKGIMDTHNATINFTTQKGEGTQFNLIFPSYQINGGI